MTGAVLSKIPLVEQTEDIPMPAKKELILAAFRIGAVAAISFWFLKWIVKYADPTYQQKQKAKTKAKELMEKIGVKDLKLNEHEVMIATHLVDPTQLKVSWADVAGLDDVIEQLKKTVIYPILAHQKVLRLSRLIQPPKGILLHGPPGCGKTLIAKAMAKEAKCWFINLDVSVLTDKWYGESQKLTAALFTLAEKLQPCIIFIDEIDSLLRLRATQDHEVTAMMKAQFMSLWDGLITDPKKTVIVMGATNRPRDMDNAIIRRMAAKFYVPLPNSLQRKHILDLTLKNEMLAPDFDLEKLSEMTDGFSGSDLKEISRAAAVSCLADMQLSRDGMELSSSRTSINSQLSQQEMSMESGGWFSRFNPFTRSTTNDCDSTSAGPSSIGHRSMSLRPISMRDFEFAVLKAKEARAHCGNPPLLRSRLELD